MGTPSASAKRSAEQKLRNKICGTKIGKCKCKNVSRTKIAEQKLVETLGHWVTGTPSASAKRSAEQKLQNTNGGTKIIHYSESPKQKLVGTVQVQKGQQNKNWWAE